MFPTKVYFEKCTERDRSLYLFFNLWKKINDFKRHRLKMFLESLHLKL